MRLARRNLAHLQFFGVLRNRADQGVVGGDEAEAARGDLVNPLRVQVLGGVSRCEGRVRRVRRERRVVARAGASVRNLRANS